MAVGCSLRAAADNPFAGLEDAMEAIQDETKFEEFDEDSYHPPVGVDHRVDDGSTAILLQLS